MRMRLKRIGIFLDNKWHELKDALRSNRFIKDHKQVAFFLAGFACCVVLLLTVRVVMSVRYPLLYNAVLVSGGDGRPDFASVETLVNAYFTQNGIQHSFYFEYLENGTGIRSDNNDKQLAASLLKLPYVMDVYKAAEYGRVDLDEPISIKAEWLDRRFGNLWRKGAGTTITLRQAARLALVDSDNTAINAVKSYDNLLMQNETSTIALDVDPEITNEAYVTAPNYSAYFRCLYRACYLNRENSQALLDMMSESKFAGIIQGVPASIKVSHKIGVSPTTHADCGIVYYPKHPYILCVLLHLPKGQYEKAMADVSRIVYQEADRAIRAANQNSSTPTMVTPIPNKNSK